MFDLTKKEVLQHFIDDFMSHNFQNAVTVDGYDISSHRYRSWEICRKAFDQYKNNGLPTDPQKKEGVVDYLALQLAFYLASWGMYRGSSFLLYLDYTVHKPVVELLLKVRYKHLFDSDALISNHIDLLKKGKATENSEYITLLFGRDGKSGITKDLTEYYEKWRKAVEEKRIEPTPDLFSGRAETNSSLSTVLVTKILMGVYGCIPAYDRYVCSGLKTQNICQTYSKKGVLHLLKEIKNKELLSMLYDIREDMKVSHTNHSYNIDNYTYMKMMDMVLWGIGSGGIVIFKKDAKSQSPTINQTNYNQIFENYKNNPQLPYKLTTSKGTYTSNNLGAIFNCVLTEDLKITDNELLKEIAKLEYNGDGDISQNYMQTLDKTK